MKFIVRLLVFAMLLALPALGIAKLSARDIMGYLVIVLLFTGLVAILGFLAWGLFFPG